MCVSAVLGGASLLGGVLQSKSAGDAADAATAAANSDIALRQGIYDDTVERFEPFYDAGSLGLQAYLYEMGLGDAPMIGGTLPEIEAFSTRGGRLGGLFGNRTGDRWQDYRVGDQTFETREEAEAFAEANRTGAQEYGGYEISPLGRYLLEEGRDTIEGGAAGRGNLFSGATLTALDDHRTGTVMADRDQYLNRLFGMTQMGSNAAGNIGSAGTQFAAGAGNAYGRIGQAQAQGALNQGNAMYGTLSDMAGIYGYSQMNPLQQYAMSYGPQ